MALFKINRGNESNLPVELKDGWAYFCTDNGNFHIDYINSDGELQRRQINSEYAAKLRYLSDGEYIELTAEQLAEAIRNFQAGQVQADWNQTDDTAADYIKNKPDISSMQTQSDWNQTDKSDVGYIKNKPFGYLDDLIPNDTYTFSAVENTSVYASNIAIEIENIPGVMYVVEWDGETYELELGEYHGTWSGISATMYGIGNPSIGVLFGSVFVPDSPANTDCPFFITSTASTNSTAASHNIRVYKKDNIVKLDKQFLPDDIYEAVQSDWAETDESKESFIKNKPEIPEAYVHPISHPASMITGLSYLATDPSYPQLLRKPFGDLAPLIEDKRLDFYQLLDVDGIYIHEYEPKEHLDLIESETYKVIWDGTEYTCVCKNANNVMNGASNTTYLGNFTIFLNAGLGDDTGEPFMISSSLIMTNDTSTDIHTISIIPVNSIHKMDAKYLPDEAATKQWVRNFAEEALAGLDISGGSAAIETDVLPETTIDGFTDDPTFGAPTKALYFGDLLSEFMVNAGEVYTVMWDGVEYEVTAQDTDSIQSGTISLGNGEHFGANGNGEPFLIVHMATVGANFADLTNSDVTTHTIRIYQKHPLSIPSFSEADDGKVLSVKGGSLSWETVASGSATTETDILPEQEITLEIYEPGAEGNSYVVRYNEESEVYKNLSNLEVGSSYVVVIDGIEYDTIAADASDSAANGLPDGSIVNKVTYIGNKQLADGGEDTGEPFAIAVVDMDIADSGQIVNQKGASIMTVPGFTSETGKHVIRIYQKARSSVSWNDIADKPFYEVQKTITVNTSTLTDVSFEGLGFTWTKVSDETLPADSVVGAKLSMYYDGVMQESVTVAERNIIARHANGIGCLMDNNAAFLIVYAAEELTLTVLGTTLTVTPPETGIYIMGASSAIDESTEIVIEGNIINKIDDKFQHQTDWDERNKSSASFLKNRPFGVEVASGDIVVEHDAAYDATEYAFILTNLVTVESHVDRSKIKVGALYTVQLGEGSYTGIGISDVDTSAILQGYENMGGIKILDSGTHAATLVYGFTGQIDLIVVESDYRSLFADGTSYAIKVVCSEDFIKKLDQKYLPDPPFFDLTAMGLPDIPVDGTFVTGNADMSELRTAAAKGLIKARVTISGMIVENICTLAYVPSSDIYSCTLSAVFSGTPLIIELLVGSNTVRARVFALQVALPSAEEATF